MKPQTIKRIVAFLLLGALVLGLVPMAVLAEEDPDTEIIVGDSEENSIGIIGGADGPTAIFVSGNWGGLVAILAAVICSGIAVIVALKKRKK